MPLSLIVSAGDTKFAQLLVEGGSQCSGPEVINPANQGNFGEVPRSGGVAKGAPEGSYTLRLAENRGDPGCCEASHKSDEVDRGAGARETGRRNGG